MPTLFDIHDEDSLMQPALAAAKKAAQLHNYFIGAALFHHGGELIATAYGAGVTAGEIFHAETQLAVLLRAGRAAGIFPADEQFIMTTTLQSCPQCRQICIQQQHLLVLYGAATKTSGAELGDLLETYTNTEKNGLLRMVASLSFVRLGLVTRCGGNVLQDIKPIGATYSNLLRM